MGKMAKKIKVDLYIDGAQKFNSDLRQCNNSIKQFESELKRNKEEFRASENSFEALSRKSATLNKAYETASQKVQIYADRINTLNKAREEEQQRITKYEAALEEEKKKLVEVEIISGKNSDAYRAQEQAVSDLEGKIKTHKGEVEKLNAEEIKLNTALNNAAAEELKYGTELEKTNKYLAEAETSTDKCAKSLDSYGRETDRAAEATEDVNESLEKLAQTESLERLSEGARKALEALIDCAETAEKFEYAMAKVQSIAQVSTDELGEMSSEIRRVATEMGYGSNEIAEATYQAISASVDAAEAVGFVEDTTKLARAGFTEVTTAVDVLTTAVNAYGKEANTTAHIADDLITTQNLGKTTVDELAQSMGTIIPTAAAYGISLDQLSTAYTILTKQGINTANATTYLSGMFSELGDAGSDVSEIFQELTGQTFGQFIKEGHSLGDVMQLLGDYCNGDSEAFANLFGNIRAGRGALALYNQGAEAFNDTLQVMANNAGATDKAFAIMADTAEMTNARFKASAENLKIAIGESLSPAMEALKNAGISALEFLTGVAEENPEFVAAIAGATVAVTTATTAVTGLAFAVSICKAAFGDFSGVVVLAGAGIAAATGALAGYGLAAANAKDETDEYTKSLHDTAEAGKELSASVDETIDGQIKQSEYIDSLVKRIQSLNSEESLNRQQKYELKNAVNDLNTALGETVVEIDNQTGKLSENSEEWIKNAKAQEEAAKVAVVQEKLNEVLQQRGDIDYQVWEATNQINDAEGRRYEIEQELLELQALGADADAGQLQRMQELYEEGDALMEKEQELKQGRLELIHSSQELGEKENELRDFMGETTGAISEEDAAARGLTDALGVVHQTAGEVEEANKAIKQATEDANAAIRDQIGLFDEWNKTSDLTLSEMIKRWEGQTSGVNQYKDDLVYLKGVIDSETDPAIRNLAENMANLGVDSAGEIHNFVEGLKEIKEGSGESATELKNLAAAWQDHMDAINGATNIYKSIQLEEKGYVDDSTALFNGFYSDSKSAREEYNKAMTDMAGSGVQDQAKAINDTAHEVEEATTNMGEGAVTAARTSLGMPEGGGQSTIFYDIGSQVSESVAKGISDGEAGIGDAMQNTLQKAADGIDVSNVASKINKKISEALNSSSFVNALAEKASAKINSDYNRQNGAYR